MDVEVGRAGSERKKMPYASPCTMVCPSPRDEYCKERLLFPLTNHPPMSRGGRASMFYSFTVESYIGRSKKDTRVARADGDQSKERRVSNWHRWFHVRYGHLENEKHFHRVYIKLFSVRYVYFNRYEIFEGYIVKEEKESYHAFPFNFLFISGPAVPAGSSTLYSCIISHYSSGAIP